MPPVRACGIDFGTSNSTVAVATDGPARLIPLEGDHQTLPSAVFWHEDDPPEFGRAAIAAYVDREEGRLMRGLKSTLGSALIDDKTRVGGRMVSFRDIVGRYFGNLRKRLDAECGPGVDHVVLGRPVHFLDNDPEGDARAQSVLEDIARAQGFRHIGFQYEPIAAALEYESRIAGEQLVLIVDIGGGTSDVSILRVSPARAVQADRQADILGNDGIRVGGTDFDRLLSLAEAMPDLGFGSTTGGGKSFMPRHYYLDLATWHRINMLYTQRTASDLKALRLDADRPDQLDRLIRVVDTRRGHSVAMEVEAAKIALTSSDTARLNLSAITGGPNPLVRRDRFEEAVAAPMDRIRDLLGAVLAQAGVRAQDVGTVFLTGGSSYLPVLRATVAQVLPGVPLATGDMLGSVGAGLALDARRRFA